ncbi:MAG: nitrous oxide reductase accessory protein NosL [Sulfurospirillum sp.]|nr:nitrous oxide reductase accessory protein NosL [Sulfurospirillum sp.]MBL0702552.1 nitrous oxide reductase accessory protein NosL [Sulfurospirillum sp.]
MRKLLLLVCTIVFVVAGDYRAVSTQKAIIIQSEKSSKFCNVCGMTLPLFYKTNHAAKVDGHVNQYCSIHCMHEEALTKSKSVVEPQVVDNNTLAFIKSEDAFYVVGSSKPATMSMVSKYAFGTKETAKTFATEFGGKVMTYEEVSKEVKEGLKKDIIMIQKRQAKGAKQGEKIYNKVCKKTDKRFTNTSLAKIYLKETKLCGTLKGKPFQQVGLFLANKGNI